MRRAIGRGVRNGVGTCLLAAIFIMVTNVALESHTMLRHSITVARHAPQPDTATTLRYHHAYVSDLAGEVYRFLLRNGLPAQQPDATLYGGLNAPFGLAFDSAGYLYVSDLNVYLVKVYAPGAEGQVQPVRILSFGRHQPGFVAVNAQGNLFVGLSNDHINIYRPGAHGNAQPIRSIDTKCCITGMLVDSAGTLFVTANDGAVMVYDDPLRRWQKPDRYLQPEGGLEREFVFNGAMALDEAHQQLYIQFSPSYINKSDGGDFAARRFDPISLYDNQIITSDCAFGDDSPGTFYGAVISGDYLLASCENHQQVEVYDADQFGYQKLVETVGSGLFQTPGDIKLGP